MKVTFVSQSKDASKTGGQEAGGRILVSGN